jgi:KDO2-lipid IV(A) lauroyltransferase
MREPLRLKAVGVAYRAAWYVTRKIPEAWAYALADRLGDRSWREGGARRRRLAANLTPVLGPGADLDAATREAFRSYARYWVETFRLPDLHAKDLDRRFATVNIEAIEKAYAAGKGAVLATMHLGNWDVGGRWVAARWPLTAVAEVLRPRKLFDRFVAHRRALGMKIVPLTKGGDAVAACARDLEEGRLVALVADRDLSGHGIEVEMFGRTTKIPPGPAVLALRTGAPLIPAVIYMCPEGLWRAWVMDPLDVPANADESHVGELTRRLAKSFEELVARDPTQWHAMFLRYWIDEIE